MINVKTRRKGLFQIKLQELISLPSGGSLLRVFHNILRVNVRVPHSIAQQVRVELRRPGQILVPSRRDMAEALVSEDSGSLVSGPDFLLESFHLALKVLDLPLCLVGRCPVVGRCKGGKY